MPDITNNPVGGLYYPVIIIGAGISGIGCACQLQRKLRFDQFMIFEGQGGIGGTWWSHRYPGVATDSPTPLYSYSFAPKTNWLGPKATGKEMYAYLHAVCEQYKFLDKIQFDSAVTELKWVATQNEWRATVVTPQRRNTVRAKIVISAVGKVGTPDMSILRDIPGIETFQGHTMHTAQWDDSVPLMGKDVTVVGGGCSAAQLVPQLLLPWSTIGPGFVTQIVRSPHWVTADPYSGRVLELWNQCMPLITRNRLGAWLARLVLLSIYELFHFTFYWPHPKGGKLHRWLQRRLTHYVSQRAPEEYHSMLTPRYAVGCKRLILDPGWFDCLHEPRFRLHNSPIKRFERSSVILEHGGQEVSVPTDVLILATGYSPGANLLSSMRITGRDEADLHNIWTARGGPQGYLGVAMDHFPNLFFICGPNSSVGHASVMAGIENSINYILQVAEPVLEGKVAALEVREEACLRWTQKVQLASRDSIWAKGGCTNWYIDPNGWNSMIYPFSQFYNFYTCRSPNWYDWNLTYTKLGFDQPLRTRSRFPLWIVVIMIACFLPLFMHFGLKSAVRETICFRPMRVSILSTS
ncbi:flavin-containing monooxygenase [Aspergillus brunneoviolaceus CBS 621.78]|uniref:FAD/NAD(P)-binding domain-containing protein n=1 Tax=Aspergillus brunneoviolaceus CBS 621.78 TaxID=1450534 RepID=A0ACD1GN61_9EURO|nr:FAD/NAD(P)-binding domain-containing protein [Aspergillus brunneoviolaceus CBS 621.78]RAH50678.1 FAD/NAD(P)-binding domain-containing protein [Aspergillus brunneoviolaceus CBS 621.78]